MMPAIASPQFPGLAWPPHVRFMIRRDWDAVLEIDQASYPEPWDESDDLAPMLNHKSVLGMVAERDDRVVGFMVYRFHLRSICVVRFAVAPDARRSGVGRAMLAKLKGKLGPRRSTLDIPVDERLLAGHLFLRSCGILSTGVDSEREGPDLYVFRHDWYSEERPVAAGEVSP